MKTLRPYQQRAVEFLAARNGAGARALSVCPAGSGKTVIGAAALAKVAQPWDRIGWACNTREQVEQGCDALAAAGVTPAWVRCVAGITPADAAELDYLVFDECHHIAASSWFALAAACKGTIYGLTATPDTPDTERNAWFNAFWGEHVIKIPREEVQRGGHLAAGKVIVLDIDTPGEFDEAIDGNVARRLIEYFANWKSFKADIAPIISAQDFTSIDAVAVLGKIAKEFPSKFDTESLRNQWKFTSRHLIENPARNATVVTTALREIQAGHSVLILVAEIEHGHAFAAQIPDAVMAFSKMGVKKRRAAIEGFRDGSVKCLIATSLADEGLDVPRASVLILATAGRSGSKVEQRTGRVMRPHEGKSVGTVYDFADRGAAMAKYQHFARLKVYKRLGYEVTKTL